MSGRGEAVPSIGQHEDFWRSDNESSKYDPKNIVTPQPRKRRPVREQESSDPGDQPVESRLLFAA